MSTAGSGGRGQRGQGSSAGGTSKGKTAAQWYQGTDGFWYWDGKGEPYFLGTDNQFHLYIRPTRAAVVIAANTMTELEQYLMDNNNMFINAQGQPVEFTMARVTYV